jgi:hydrogenase nickel incorporation protein HypA/HybF
MHELSIALSIIESVEEEVVHRGGARVTAVHLKLGPLSGVVKDALLFSYDLVCEGTSLAGSKLEIQEIPVMLLCPVCRKEQPAESLQELYCGVCGTPSADIRAGDELEIVALELTDEHAA